MSGRAARGERSPFRARLAARASRGSHYVGFLAATLLGGACVRAAASGVAPAADPSSNGERATSTRVVEDSVAGALLDALAERDRTPRLVVADSTWADLVRPEAVTPVAAAADSLASSLTATAGGAAGDAAPSIGADLVRANRRPRALAPAGARTPVTLLARQVYAPVDPGVAAAFWATFPARYPGAAGVLSLSRPGFAADGRAAVAVRRLVGPSGSVGELFLLRRAEGRWRVVGARTLWVS